jgi:hypothetical protein
MRKLTKFSWALVAMVVLATTLAPLMPARTTYAQENDPGELLLQEQLKSIIDNRCAGQPSGTPRDQCYQGYNSWIRECNNRATESAENADGNKNDAYRDRFAQCMNNNTGSLGQPLNETAVRNALSNDIYDQIVEANSTPINNGETCESSGGALAWIFCPILQMLDGAAGTLTDLVEETLYVDEDKYESESLANSWRSMRNIALLILVPMMLFMVIGTALEFGPFDAYTVKKALPRMFIAVMFIVLSLEITQFFVNLSNLIGRGIEGLVLASTNNPESLGDYYSKGGGVLFTALVSGGAVIGVSTGAITLGIVGSLAFVTFLALLIAYLVLVLRELLILALIMVAPLAILVWIFPGNDKLWKVWKTTFTALLMMFPLIILLITSGKVFAGLIQDTQGSFTAFFLKIIAFIAPFFLIPATFKYGMGVFGNLAGIINDRSRGVFDRQRKFREGSKANARHQAMTGNRFAGGNSTNFRGKINRGISGSLNAPGAVMSSGNILTPSNWRTATRTAMQNTDVAEVERNMKENQAYQSWMYDDGMNRIAAESNNEQQLRDNLAANGYSGRSLEDAVARVETVRRSMGDKAFKIMTTRQALAGGTAYESAGEAWAAAAAAAGDDDAAAQYLVANGRSEGMKAGRIDYAGAGFGATIGAVDTMRAELRATKTISTATQALVNNQIHANVYEGQGGTSLVHSSMKPGAVEEMAPEMTRTIQTSLATGDTRDMSQRFASLAAVYDGMASSSPQKARIVADNVLSQQIDVSTLTQNQRNILDRAITVRDDKGNAVSSNRTITYQQAIEGLRGNQQFQEMRREYQSQVAAIQSQQVLGGQQPGTPPGQLPGAPGGP